MFERFSLAAVTMVALAGCAIGAMTQPVSRELRTTPAMYESNFSAAVRALNAVGSVTSSDKAEGYVNGLTSMNVKMTVQISKDGTVKVNGQLPSDKFLMGTSLEKEVDKFMAALQPNMK